MGIKRRRKTYNLEYIEKVFKIVPILFILIICVLSIVIAFFVLDFKQNKEISLLEQNTKIHFEFRKKEILHDFVTSIQHNIDFKLERVINNLKKHTYKMMGHLEDLSINNAKKYIKAFEQNSGFNVLLLRKKNLEPLYDSNNLPFLQRLIFGKVSPQNKQKVLDFINSNGKEDVQYWDDLSGHLKISFVEEITIERETYYLGLFSSEIVTSSVAKEISREFIKKLDEELDYDIWFMDLKNKDTFNYFNNHESVNFNEIKPKENLKYKILNHFIFNKTQNFRFDKVTYVDKEFQYMMAIDYDATVMLDTSLIEQHYRKWFITLCVYIVVASLVLLSASLLFSRFTKNILDKYSRKLRIKTNSLLHWKQRFEFAVIASNDGLWDINFETHKIFFSSKWLEMTGYKRGYVTQFSDWFELIHPEDKAQIETSFEKIFLMQSDTFLGEYRLKINDGSYKWMLTRGRIFRQEGAYKNRMLMMSMDIDNNKMMKKELSDIELLVDDGEIVIFKLLNDKPLNVKYISKSIKNYGYFKYEFESRSMTFLQLIHDEDLFRVKQLVEKSLRNDLSHFSFVCRVVNALAQIRWVSCRMVVIKDHTGEVLSFYGYMNDITQIKVSEEELKQKVQEEVSNNRDKDRILIQQSKLASMGEMIGSIAHQWRQPLNNVSLFMQFLQDNYRNENVNVKMIDNYFSRARTQIGYMSQTIDDFRNFYKSSHHIMPFDLDDVMQSTLEIVRVPMEEHGITLFYNCPKLEMLSYENELRQAILNILNNAKDALLTKREKESFTPLVELNVTHNETHVEIEIYNNGGGIPEDIVNRIFEPYFTTKFETKGTGIGLYMTKTLVEKNMKGSIEACNVKEGVVFKITLPLMIGG